VCQKHKKHTQEKLLLKYLMRIFCSLVIPFFNVTASEKTQEFISLEWVIPTDMLQNIAKQLSIVDIAALKQTCSTLNNGCHYWGLFPTVISTVDDLCCTKALCHFTHTNQNQNFSHFFAHNNEEKRRQALELLNWPYDSNLEQSMRAYRIGFNALPHTYPDWDTIFNNKIALTMICLSDNPNIQNPIRYTVLIQASAQGCTDIVELLLANPLSNPNIKNSGDNTALIIASLYGYTDIVKLLLSNLNTDINIQNNYCETALMWACFQGHRKIVQLLLVHPDINISLHNKVGDTAYSWARNHTEIVKLFNGMNHS